MFWRFAFQANADSFETLLDKLDQAEVNSSASSSSSVKLVGSISSPAIDESPVWQSAFEAVLKDGELLPELKKGNDRLLQWLCKPEVINRMFGWVFENGEIPQPGVIEPSSDNQVDDKDSDSNTEEDPSKEDTESSNNAPVISNSFLDGITLPSDNHDDSATDRRKLAFVSLEVLSFESPRLQEAILRQPEGGLKRLWDVVYLPANTPIPAHMSVAFGRIFTSLISRRTRQALLFLYEQERVVESMITHLDDNLVLDILLKVLCMEEMAEGQGVSEWLHDQQLIPRLVDCMAPIYGYETHSSVSQVLLHILAIAQTPVQPGPQSTIPGMGSLDSGNSQASTTRCFSLVKELTSEATLSRLMNFMLDPIIPDFSGRDQLPASQLISTLTFGVTIFIEIIRRHYLDSDNDQAGQSSPHDSPPPSPLPPSNVGPPPVVDLGILVGIVTRHLPDLVKLLTHPRSVTESIANTAGDYIPLGFERLKVCELIAELLHGSNMKTLNMVSAPISSEEMSRLLQKRSIYLDFSSLGDNAESENDLSIPPSHSDVINQFHSNKFEQFGTIETIIPTSSSEGNNLKSFTDDPESVPISSDKSVNDLKNVTEDSDKNSTTDQLPDISGLQIDGKPKEVISENSLSIGEWAKLSILDNNVLNVFLDLFLNYPWNNFIHVVVFDIIHQVLNLPTHSPTNLALISSLFLDVKLTEKIVAAQRHNDIEAQKPRGVRLGYMGYLTFIAEETVKLLDRAGYELGQPILTLAQAPEWQEYIYQSLRDTKQRDMEPLDGNLSSAYGSNTQISLGLTNNESILGDLATITAADPHFSNGSPTDSHSNERSLKGLHSTSENNSNEINDDFTSLEPTNFASSGWGVDDDDEDDDDDDDEITFPNSVPSHLTHNIGRPDHSPL